MEQRGFSCRIENSKNISDVLSCLLPQRKDQICLLEASTDSLIFFVSNRSSTSQARVTIPSSLFEDYFCDPDTNKDESIRIALNLSVLIDCFHIIGTSSTETSATLSYNSVDVLLRLSLEDAGILTSCEIRTIDPGSLIDGISYSSLSSNLTPPSQLGSIYGIGGIGFGALFAAFRESPESAQLILRADLVKEAVSELLEVNGSSSVLLQIHRPNSTLAPHITGASGLGGPGLVLSTKGNLGACEIEFPSPSESTISFTYSSPNPIIEWTYPLTLLTLGFRPLIVSTETALRINEKGGLCLQHLVEVKSTCSESRDFNKGKIFIDFLLTPFNVNPN